MFLIQRRPDAPLAHEESLAWQYATMEQIKTRGFTPSQMQDGELPIENAELVVGSVESIASALQQVNRTLPKPNYYPAPLKPWMYRNLSGSTAQIIRWRIDQGESLFVKSKDYKVMTGTVCSSSHHCPELQMIDNETEVWAGDVVKWLSEYRLYITKHEVVGCTIYEGDERFTLDTEVITRALERMKDYGWHDTYTMDWGILRQSDGGLKTALVEVNDAWAIGAYPGINYRQYTELLMRRWQQLTQ